MANIGPAAGSNPQTPVGNPNFHTGIPHQIDIDRFNLWKQVRAPPGVPFVPATMEELRDSFRLHNYVAPDPPVNQAPVRTQQPAPRQLRAPVTTPAQQQFLDHTIPEFRLSGSNQAPDWKGKKILGQGGYAMVGLWQYEGPDIHAHPVIQIAVKETMPVVPPQTPTNLREEAEMMKKIHKPIPSKHIVQLVKYPQFQNVQRDEGLGPEWDDKVRRIFMEYCPFGSLSQLIRNRIKTQKPLKEATLWRIFDCLVDGASVLAYGRELVMNTVMNQVVREPGEVQDEIVHFDLKPGNIFLGQDLMDHAFTPVCKMGDLGLAQRISINTPLDNSAWRRRWRTRYRGTRGYFTPEQFTERWDFKDFRTSGVAGLYSSASNIWQIGCIMWRLVMLSYDPPPIHNPFLPGWLINGAAAKGLTYGFDLQAYTEYSQGLRNLIFVCLYEKPSNRPDCLKLKAEVYCGWRITVMNANEAIPEPWDSFIPLDPVAAQTPAPAPQATGA